MWVLFFATGTDRGEKAELELAGELKRRMDAAVMDLPKHHLIFCAPERREAEEALIRVRTRAWVVQPVFLFPRGEPSSSRGEAELLLARWYMDEIIHAVEEVAPQRSGFAVCAQASEIELTLGFAYTLGFKESSTLPPATYAPFQMRPGSVALVRMIVEQSMEKTGKVTYTFVDLDQAQLIRV